VAPENRLDAQELFEITRRAKCAGQNAGAFFETAIETEFHQQPRMTSNSPTLSRPAKAPAMLCPFHDGIATLDLLLAELDPLDRELFDAVLDLRALANDPDAGACVAQLYRVRALLDGRHYLAFYRVRCWARRTFRIEVRTMRGAPAVTNDLPLDGGRLEQVVNSSLAAVAHGGELPVGAQVRFVFAANISDVSATPCPTSSA
jgi:hypothetical protein